MKLNITFDTDKALDIARLNSLGIHTGQVPYTPDSFVSPTAQRPYTIPANVTVTGAFPSSQIMAEKDKLWPSVKRDSNGALYVMNTGKTLSFNRTKTASKNDNRMRVITKNILSDPNNIGGIIIYNSSKEPEDYDYNQTENLNFDAFAWAPLREDNVIDALSQMLLKDHDLDYYFLRYENDYYYFDLHDFLMILLDSNALRQREMG